MTQGPGFLGGTWTALLDENGMSNKNNAITMILTTVISLGGIREVFSPASLARRDGLQELIQVRIIAIVIVLVTEAGVEGGRGRVT